MNFEKYLHLISGNYKKAVKVEWLNPDESVNFEFTNAIYDINVDLSVNYQNGSRRTCTITLNNDRNKFPINFNNIWIGQKFKLWMGIYLDEKTPYYFPQGVFYISNPNEVYEPITRTIKINGVDKWAFLDGTLGGKLSGVYVTNIGVNLFEATKELLLLPTWTGGVARDLRNSDFDEYFDTTKTSSAGSLTVTRENSYIKISSQSLVQDHTFNITFKKHGILSFDVETHRGSSSSNPTKISLNLSNISIFDHKYTSSSVTNKINVIKKHVYKGDVLSCKFTPTSSNDYVQFSNFVFTIVDCVDPIPPLMSKIYETKKDDSGNAVIKCPYTMKTERGKTYADVLLEYATILCAHVYYDTNGRLTIEPMINNADDITDTDKEVMWHYTVDEKTFLGLTQTYNFDKVYNDIIVLGNIVEGKQFKARVQNQNLMSDTCVQKIGLKTKEPFEDNQYYSDEQCKELAMYYAKVDTILQKSGDISSTPLYHLDVNKLVAVSTPNNNMSKELFLINGYTLNSSNTMSVNVTSVNVLKDFSVVEADI